MGFFYMESFKLLDQLYELCKYVLKLSVFLNHFLEFLIANIKLKV